MKQKRYRPDKDGSQRQQFEKNKKTIRLQRDVCQICGLPINYDLKYPDPWSFTADHIVPVIYGGRSDLSNMQAAHFRCNRLKGTRLQLSVAEINKLRLEQGCTDLLPEEKAKPVRTDPIRQSRIFSHVSKTELIANDDLPLSMDWTTYTGE